MSASESVIREKTDWIKSRALQLGFSAVGISKAEFLQEEADRLKEWLDKGLHGQMKYMENHFDLRTDPRKLVDNCASVISFMYNYYTPESQDQSRYKISKYAFGRDYHKVIKKKLKILSKDIEDRYGTFTGRSFVDSGPVMEREWAKRSGLGWLGKNTLLINPKKGSYFFLAEMLVDFELRYDDSMSDYCGSCTRCIEACPTDAIYEEGYIVDASKCISYLTIELKEEIPEAFSDKMDNWIFGCDICQDVCPWNRFSTAHEEPEFVIREGIKNMEPKEWVSMDEEEFNKLFSGSAVKRTGYHGLKRNIKFIEKKEGNTSPESILAKARKKENKK